MKRNLIPRNKRGPSKLKPDVLKLFLDVFKECNSIRQAAKAIGVSPQAIYKLKAKDESFAHELEQAEAEVLDNLEAEAYRRAVTGVKKAIYHQGAIVGYELQYSDKLLEMLLRGRAKDKYSNSTNVNLKGEVNHTIDSDQVLDKLLNQALSKGLTLDGEAEDADFEEQPKLEPPEDEKDISDE